MSFYKNPYAVNELQKMVPQDVPHRETVITFIAGLVSHGDEGLSDAMAKEASTLVGEIVNAIAKSESVTSEQYFYKVSQDIQTGVTNGYSPEQQLEMIFKYLLKTSP